MPIAVNRIRYAQYPEHQYYSFRTAAGSQRRDHWSLSGAAVGFISWLLALGIPFLIYGSNTLFVFLYTAVLPALMPVAVVVGIALHSLMDGKLQYSVCATILTVGLMFGLLFLWLLG